MSVENRFSEIAAANIPQADYAVLEAARLPFAVLTGSSMLLSYANPSFCKLVEKENDDILGKPFSALMPENDSCLLLLVRFFVAENAKPIRYISMRSRIPFSGPMKYGPYGPKHQRAGALLASFFK
jgi:PAS domain-containing protein